ncbi:MAG: phytanoyl-CoA dioxygenase family protein [Verrucomicrobia bacterium]|nr:phytanoyl-CoA dioxygenase family protein [Verrucomicrobiota bacterium]MBT7067853.1 phytanoyl-CoA dioxygenase family protein [Verrucomicrobiota bacterium]MBT7699807.1 phytanoyl-CoA dioxygenase family protein [Verrucomicrobiota bacterium]
MFELTTDQVDRFERDGFVNGGQLLTDAEVESLRGELERVIEEDRRSGKSGALNVANLKSSETPIIQIVNIWMGSDPFRDVMMRQDLGKVARELMGSQEVRIWHDQIQYKPSGNGGVNMWHQDWPYWPSLSAPEQVTAWVALDEVDMDNGCMSMVPGSHKWGKQIDFLHALNDFESMPETLDGKRLEVVPCPVKKGEVHFHHALTWHGSHANTSGRSRRAIAFHYMNEKTRFVAGAQHICSSLSEVGDGEKLVGKHFPLVFP